MPSPPPRPPLALRCLMAVVPLALLLALTELTLGLLGAGAGSELSRGFDPEARYLVPDPDVPGGHLTRIYLGEQDRSDFAIAPRGDRERVLLMGGSNTRWFPEAHLQERLDAGAPPDHPGFEVLNLGREGYGSERVAILLEQALVELDPDMVVIYAGHNEMVEQRFADELSAGGSTGWTARVQGWVSGLRSYQLLRAAIASGEVVSTTTRDDGQRTPERWVLAGTSPYSTLQWEGTLRYLRAYQTNLRRMCRATVDAGCQLLLCTLANNDLPPPVSTREPDTLSADEQRLIRSLDREVLLGDGPIPFGELTQGRELRRALWWMGEERNPDHRAPELRPLSGFLAAMPATVGPPPTPEGAHWPHPRFWNTQVMQIVGAYSRFLAPQLSPRQRAWLRHRRSAFLTALAVIPDDPAALYNLGITRWLLDGDRAGATALLRKASALDRVPLSANDTINALVREVAAEDPAIALLDVDAMVREASPDGLVGYEVMFDHSHMHSGVATALMEVMAERLLADRAR